jgi:hypothetical protein
MNNPHIVAFGGGVDSTAMILGLIEKELPIDLILFADTGAERPSTYEHIENFSNYLNKLGHDSIQIVKNKNKLGEIVSLEDDCLKRKCLPSIAYGFKTCSSHFKIQPQDKFLNNWQPAKETWAKGEKCIKYVGYDAGEQHRADNAAKRQDPKYTNKYPLIEWQWEREDCLNIIAKHGITNVGKSACFFCPSSKPKEIVDLYEKHPDLAQRALDIEKQAELTSIKGLGRNYAWSEVILMHKSQMTLPFVGFDLPCECTE